MSGERPKVGGCYDLIGRQSLPPGEDACRSGDATILPANESTRSVVTEYIKGGRINISTNDNGVKRVTVPGFDGSEEVVILSAPPREEGPIRRGPDKTAKEPARKQKKRKRHRTNRHTAAHAERGPDDVIGLLRRRKKVPAVAVKREVEKGLPPDATIKLSSPLSTRNESVRGSGGFDELMRDIAASVDGMSCGVSGCRCSHPPCIPCGLDSFKISGKTEEQWAANWIAWFSLESTTSERMIAIRSLTSSESEVLKAAKYRWGFARRIDDPISRFDWKRGGIPARYVSAKAIAALRVGASRVRIETKKVSPEDVRNAVSIVVDLDAPAAARIYAIKWLDRNGCVDGDVANILKKIAMGDPDESVRAVALDVYELYKDRQSKSLADKGP